MSAAQLRAMVDPGFTRLPLSLQCGALGLPRSTYYYTPVPVPPDKLRRMHLMDRIHLDNPCYGHRRLCAILRGLGETVGPKGVLSLMRLMGIEPIWPKPDTSKPNKEHKVFPYLLRGVEIVGPDHVWSTDITYIGMAHGFLYLCAIIDWFSRRVITWDLSNTMEKEFCMGVLDKALAGGRKPLIFNTDQGSQFTSNNFTQMVLDNGIEMSMDGKGRATDNAICERLWRSVKQEYVYLYEFGDGLELHRGLGRYFENYNHHRPHQSLDYSTPQKIYFQ